jgi:hypothetical protein
VWRHVRTRWLQRAAWKFGSAATAAAISARVANERRVQIFLLVLEANVTLRPIQLSSGITHSASPRHQALGMHGHHCHSKTETLIGEETVPMPCISHDGAMCVCADDAVSCLIRADDRVLLDSLCSPQPALAAQLHARVVVRDPVRLDLRPTRSQCRPERGIGFRGLAPSHDISPPSASCRNVKGHLDSESV